MQSDLQDLDLLGTFVSTLESAVEQSAAIRKLHHACSNFHQIAKAYVAHRSRHVALGTDSTENVVTDCQLLGVTGEPDPQSLPDFSLSQQDWDLMLDDWNLGLGAEDARNFSSFLNLLPNTQ